MNDGTTILTFNKKMGKLTKAIGAVSAAFAMGGAAAEYPSPDQVNQRQDQCGENPECLVQLQDDMRLLVKNVVCPPFQKGGTDEQFLKHLTCEADRRFYASVAESVQVTLEGIEIRKQLTASEASLANSKASLKTSKGVLEAMQAAAALQKKQEQKPRKRSQSG